jgi:glycosyltransferase involved in cell wall biosynthesis
MNIAFIDTNLDSASWTAGPIYLKNLAHAIRRADATVGLFTLPMAGSEGARARAESIAANGVIYHTPPARWRPDWAVAWAQRRLGRDSLPLEWTLQRAGIDVLFGFPAVQRIGSIPTLGWLNDFQHVYLPGMFSPAERSDRDRMLLTAARETDRLVAMSEAVRQDLLAFAPSHAYKARVLKPVAEVPEAIYDRDPIIVARRYHLPDKFVYVPNQFWMHKNHETLFRAVKLLKERGLDVRVVCTGHTFDNRNPQYFAELSEKLSLWDLRSHVVYLGLIDHDDALALMRQSVCVLNPSLFEGWGYSAEEARSVGKRTLLSDIPAHREQSPPKGAFFDPHDCTELADKLEEIWKDCEPGPDNELEARARAAADERMRSYGAGFLRIAREAIDVTGKAKRLASNDHVPS